MSTLALTGTTRRWITKLHRWSGLLLLLFLLIAGITGAILSFRWEIDRAINPHLFRVTPQAEAMPYQALIDAVEKRYPDAMVSTVIVPKTPQDAAIVYIKAHMEAHVAHVHVPGMKSSVDFNQIFVNPYSGQVLGQRSTTRFVPTMENLVPVLVRLHYTLFADEWGAWVMGVSAVAWFLSSFVGLALAWPSPWRSARAWKPVVTLGDREGSYRLNYKLNYRLHRLVAVVTWPILIVIAFSSIYLNWPKVVRPVVEAVSPLFNTDSIPSAGAMNVDAPRATIEQAMATAREAMPGARVQSVGRNFHKGLYSVRMQLPGDVSPTGNNVVFVRMRDGQSVFQRTHAAASPGDVFIAWQWPLHTGSAFGFTGQILVLLGSLAVVAMCITGFNVWLRKWRGSRRQPFQQPVAAGECTG